MKNMNPPPSRRELANAQAILDACEPFPLRPNDTRTIPVFVYGTLKRGKHNHRLLDHEGARFICEARTDLAFPLVVDGLPYLYNRPGEGERVTGEFYHVDEATLAELDRLEGHPRFYKREPVTLRRPTNFAVVCSGAWCYFINSRAFRPEDKPVAQF